MVSNARLDFPDPESPVTQTSRFRGRRTVMFFRLCSRAPWTTSWSAMRPVYPGASDGNACSVSGPRTGLAGVPATIREMRETARRAFIGAIVFVGVVAAALALWKLKVLIALLFLAFIIAAAMRPGVDRLRRRGIPRGAGIIIHYVAFAAVVGLLLWQAVPQAIEQIRESLPGGNIPTTGEEVHT